jgi:hypothetical protein
MAKKVKLRLSLVFVVFFTGCISARVDTKVHATGVNLRVQLPYLSLQTVMKYEPQFILSGCTNTHQTGVKDGPHSVVFSVDNSQISKEVQKACRFVIRSTLPAQNQASEWLEEEGKLLEDPAVSLEWYGVSGVGIVQSDRFLNISEE